MKIVLRKGAAVGLEEKEREESRGEKRMVYEDWRGEERK